MDISCIILAGGRGLRLGRDKTSEIIGDKSLLGHVINNLSFLNSEIIIVKAVEQSLAQVNYPRLRIVADVYSEKGPLGGIYAGLEASETLYNLVVACDMPFLNRDLLHYMIRISGGFDLVIPRLKKMIEPLHAIYSKNCLKPIEYLLKQNKLQIRQIFSLINIRYVETSEANRFDPEHLSFFNINTEADLERARALFRGGYSQK